MGLAIDGANRHDKKLVEATLESIPVHRDLPEGGEEAQALKREAGYKARRWVVERTHSWMNRFRRILIRWEKKAANYLALLHFACAWITYRAAGLLG